MSVIFKIYISIIIINIILQVLIKIKSQMNVKLREYIKLNPSKQEDKITSAIRMLFVMFCPVINAIMMFLLFYTLISSADNVIKLLKKLDK